MSSLRAGLADPAVSPVQAALRILTDELWSLTSWLAAQEDPVAACALYQRFGAMIHATPALRAHQRDMTDTLIGVASEVLAARAGLEPGDPEPQIAATALLGLWHVQSLSLRRHLSGEAPERERKAVTADVLRAAETIDVGLHSFG